MKSQKMGNKSWLPKSLKDDMMFPEYVGDVKSKKAYAAIVAKHLDEVIIRRNIKPDNKGNYCFQELLSTWMRYVGKNNFTHHFRKIMKEYYDYKFKIVGKVIVIEKINT